MDNTTNSSLGNATSFNNSDFNDINNYWDHYWYSYWFYSWDDYWYNYWNASWTETADYEAYDPSGGDHEAPSIISATVQNILKHCGGPSGVKVWLGLKVFILLTAFPANGALLWLLFQLKQNLSPSQLLAFHGSVLNILYCLFVPLDIYDKLNPTSDTFHDVMESVSALVLFGCPLFLTFMCLERYVAAAFPLTYLRFGKRKHRVILSVVAWSSTVCVAFFMFFFDAFVTVLILAVVIFFVFFLIMLLCLAGIVYVLCQSQPGEGASSSNALKKQALCNITMVIVPSAVAYTPLVAVVCYLAVVLSTERERYTEEHCTVLQYLLAFPNFGLYIGPLFYTSMIRQITCCKTAPEHSVSPTQAE